MNEMGLMYVPGPEHLCPHGLGKAVPCQACEYDNLRTRVDRAEAELARVRPVVDAAEALTEHWTYGAKEDSPRAKKNHRLLVALTDRIIAAEYTEAQR